MIGPLSRRKFMQIAGQAGALAGTTALIGEALAAEAQGPAAAVSAVKLRVACRDAMLKHVAQPDCWAAMTLIDVEGVEAAITDDLALPGLFHPTEKYTAATPEGLQRVAADMAAAGRSITALCMFNKFEQRPEFEVAWGKRVAEAARALKVPAIRIDLAPQKMERPAFLKFAIELMKRLMEATEATGVAFGIENHGRTTNDPEFLGPLFDGVGSKRLGLTLDTGNFYWFGHPLTKLYQLYEQFAPRVVHTHCKSIRYPADEREKQRPIGWRYGEFNCPIYEGDIDFRRVVGMLKKAGYKNDLCIEDESLGKKPADECTAILTKEAKLLAGLC